MSENKKEHKLPSYINIPFFLYQDRKLNKSELLLASFIYSLHTAGRKIVVGNDYLHELVGTDERNVRDNLEKLEKKKYLKRIGFGSNRKILWIHNPISSIVLIDDVLCNKDDSIRVGQQSINPDDNILSTRMTASSIY